MEARAANADLSFAIFRLYANATTIAKCFAATATKLGEYDGSRSTAISEAPRLQEPKRVTCNAVQIAVDADAINEQVSQQAR